MRALACAALALVALVADSGASRAAVRALRFPQPAPDGWRATQADGVRGITIGPIENGYHPGVGYGSAAYGRTLDECKKMGARWIAITTFGRVLDLTGRGVDPTFERPFAENRADVVRAIHMAHARGLSVMLVPHLWVEAGGWRAEIDPPSDAAWEAWAASYGAFVERWAGVAEETRAELFSVGVELRSWVTTRRAPSFVALVRRVRGLYHGPLTYSGNWDDVEYTHILGELDVIGINAFYPLAEKEGAGLDKLLEGGERVRGRVHALAEAWRKPVLFTEIGYTTRPDPAVKPWIWPEDIKDVKYDERAQADAYRGLLAPLLDEPYFMGFFVWRVYADPDDVSQEPGFGFSPRGKLAELVVRDAFATTWASDWNRPHGWPLAARVPGIWP